MWMTEAGRYLWEL
jgi:inosose dehydratase